MDIWLYNIHAMMDNSHHPIFAPLYFQTLLNTHISSYNKKKIILVNRLQLS